MLWTKFQRFIGYLPFSYLAVETVEDQPGSTRFRSHLNYTEEWKTPTSIPPVSRRIWIERRNRWEKKTAASCPAFPSLGFDQSHAERSRIRRDRIIGYEHNLLSNGGYPLSLNPHKVPATLYRARDCLSPLYQRVPIMIAVVQSSQRRPLSVGGDTVWSVYHCTSNTWDSIRLRREIARARRWPTDGR